MKFTFDLIFNITIVDAGRRSNKLYEFVLIEKSLFMLYIVYNNNNNNNNNIYCISVLIHKYVSKHL